jgi:REP element-mobilizing transposase RayT
MAEAQEPPPRRKSPRHRGHDYRLTGHYFITVCVAGRACVFGEVINANMRLSELGALVDAEWRKTVEMRENVKSIAHVVMPNHFHCLLLLDNPPIKRAALQPGEFGPASAKVLGTIVGAFKSAVTTHARQSGLWSTSPLWQPRFHDRIARDETEFFRIRAYINRNPASWSRDRENPSRDGEDDFDRWLATGDELG